MADQIAEVKSKVDIVSVIGSRVELKAAGKNMRGLCPFHSERTPSFFVSPEMQSFKCFGCGKGGDVFTFMQDYEGMDFREALEYLAEKVGVKLESYRPVGEEQKRKRGLEILSLAAEYYHYVLMQHKAGEVGRQYLTKRGVDRAVMEKFYLGFAPESWEGVYKYLVGKKKYGADEVEAVGLVIRSQRGGGFYDRFRGRVMFPLKNFSGKVVGFSGRLVEALEGKDGAGVEAKYINTPETDWYHKRELLFGVDQAKTVIRSKNQAIVVEGEFDVISSHVAGVANVVGVKGSALTEDQVRLMLRLTRNLVLCLDADEAGIEATKRGIEVADRMGMDMGIVSVSGGKDPDDVARSNPKEWKRMVGSAVSVYEFLMMTAEAKYGLDTIRGKKLFGEEIARMLIKISNKVEQAYYVKEAALKLGVSEEVVWQEMEKAERALKLGRVEEEKDASEERVVGGRGGVLENYVWGLMLNLEGKRVVKAWKMIEGWKWAVPGLERLAGEMSNYLERLRGEFELSKFVSELPAELSGLVGRLYLNEKTVGLTKRDEVWRELEKVVEELEKARVREELAQLREKMTSFESRKQKSDQDKRVLAEMKEEFSRLVARL